MIPVTPISNLTKENFWNALQEKYPEQMKIFCTWIDEYKKLINWSKLFNVQYHYLPFYTDTAPKFHDLPFAMQIGIFMQFVVEMHESGKITGGFVMHVDQFHCMDFYLEIPNKIMEYIKLINHEH